jgi:hypothetical protein
MKLLLVLACVALAVVAGAAGALLVRTAPPLPPTLVESPSTMSQPVDSRADAQAARSASLGDPTLAARVDELVQEVAALREELARMREGTSRAPILSTESTDGNAAVRTSDDFAELHREGILQLVEEDRQAREQKREADRAQREEEALLARAERVAKEVGLTASQQKSLADVYTLERQKIDELRKLAIGGDFAEMPVQIREQIAGLRQWRTEELTARFGSELAQKINENDADRFGRGRRGREGGPVGDFGSRNPR